MEVTLLFLVTLTAFTALLLYDNKAAFFTAVLFYGIYPRFFALGFAEDGFALTMQRAMLFLLLAMYVARWLLGSADVRQGWQLMTRHRAILIALLVYLLARLVGNLTTGRIDLSVAGQLVSESLISIFVMLLVTTYVRTRRDIVVLITLIMLSLLMNQLISIYEFVAQQPIFPADLSLSYEIGGRGEAVVAGRIRDESFRAMGVFDNPLKLVALLSMALPLVACLWTAARSLLVKVLAGTAIALALPTAIFSGSRAALGVVGLVFAWYAYRWVTRNMQTTGRRVVAVCAMFAGVALLAVFADDLIREALFGDAYARSTEARYMAYVTVPLMLVEAPFFGFGYARNIVDTLELGALDPFYLRLALEGGLVSLLAFIAFLFGSIRSLAPVVQSHTRPADIRLARALRLSLAIIALLALILTLSYVRMYVFLFAGLALVLLEISLRDQASSSVTDRSP